MSKYLHNFLPVGNGVPGSARVLDLLAALSHQTRFSVGCYFENEERCNRSLLKKLLAGRGAEFAT